MSGIPVLHVEAEGIARAWEMSLIELYRRGCRVRTQYDQPANPASRDCTMMLTIHDPLSEPMLHKDFPGGPVELQEYVMEVCEGIKDHLLRNPEDPGDTRWDYTYHQRLFAYDAGAGATVKRAVNQPFHQPFNQPFNQIDALCRNLAETPYSRRAQAITWNVGQDSESADPPCLQSVWCRITEEETGPLLNMNVRFRSNDAYRAAFMNIFALVQLQKQMAEHISALSGRTVRVGRYCHVADSYHIYGASFPEFERRFLGALEKRTFEERTMRYEDVRDIMDAARSEIAAKAARLGR